VLVDLIKIVQTVLEWLMYDYIVYSVFLIYVGLLYRGSA